MTSSQPSLTQWINARTAKVWREIGRITSPPLLRWRAWRLLREYDRSLSALPPAVAPGPRLWQESGSPIVAVYFSCGRDFDYLLMSVRSLLKFAPPHLERIFIYEDASGPFSEEQRGALAALYPATSIVTGPRVTGWGVESATRELTFFRHVVRALPDSRRRFVAKIDSDVLFLSPSVFEDVACCAADVFGQPFTSAHGLTYPQGGCYFIASDFLDSMVYAPICRAMGELSWALKKPIYRLPEDASVFQVARKLSARVQFSEYYLPHQRVPTFTPSPDERASVIHFETGLGPHLRPHMARIGAALRVA